MPQFTLHRNHVLRTTKGHSIRFIKGEPVWVPPVVVPDAVAIGAIPVEEGVDVIGEEEKPAAPLTPEERKQKIIEAVKVMVARKERSDFTASGVPNSKRLQSLVGFEVLNRERDEVWRTYQQSLLVEDE